MINEEEKQNDSISPEAQADVEKEFDRKEKEAIKLVEKRTLERQQRRVMKLRKIALTTVTLSVVTFLIAVFSGIALYYWYNTKIVQKTSMMITRFTAEHLAAFQIVHFTSALLTFLLFFVFIVLFLNFQKQYSEIPHQGKTRKVSGFIASTVGLVAIVMIVLNFLTGISIPDKKTKMSEMQKNLESESFTNADGPISLAELSSKMNNARAAGLAELANEKEDLNYLLHTSLLPIIFAILIFIILFDVYTLQKAKFKEITPKIKPH